MTSHVARRCVALLALLLLVPAVAGAADEALVWRTDYDAAMTEATSAKRPTLLLFTGTAWCPPCQQMERHFFKWSNFAKFAREQNLMLIKLDYPRSNPPAALQELAEAAKVESYPTVILFNSKGEPIFRESGFAANMAQTYLAALKQRLGVK